MNGLLSIHKTSSNQSETASVTLELRFEGHLFRVYVELADFAEALLGRSEMPCEVEDKSVWVRRDKESE